MKISKSELKKDYVNLTIKDLTLKYECSTTQIYRILKQANIELRGSGNFAKNAKKAGRKKKVIEFVD